jgi:hypothetical protein
VPREIIGQCGCAQYPDRRWITAELELAMCFIRHACGSPPERYNPLARTRTGRIRHCRNHVGWAR